MGRTVLQEHEFKKVKVKGQNRHPFRNKSEVPAGSNRSSLISSLASRKINSSSAISPEPVGDIENQLLIADGPPGVLPQNDATGMSGIRNEDLMFVNKIKKKSQRGVCYCLYTYVVWVFTGFGIPKLLYRMIRFLVILLGQFAFAVYARTLWECCGVPVSKLNKQDYLLSKYMGISGDVPVAFNLLKIEKEEQLQWLEEWEAQDSNADDRMDITEFHRYFDLKGVRNELTERMFKIYNTNYNGYINFKDFLTQSWTYAPYDRERCCELSFRLMSRRGDTFDIDSSCIDLMDLEHFVQERYNRNNKKPEKWVKKIAVALYAHIDQDMSGGIDYQEFRKFALENRIFLLYGFWFQSQLRKTLFGEDYWKVATEARRNMYFLDVPFTEKMMQLLDAPAVYSIGMVPKDAMVPKKNDRATFQKDFHEAFYSYKEKKFKAKQDKKKDTTVASTLAAKTHTRLIKIFSRIVPDGMNLMTAFLHWKDVNFYSKSLVEDGGASYKAHNMSLVDLKIAGVANSVGKSTAKLAVALHADFEAEAEAELFEGKKFSKKEKKEHARKRVAAKVLSEVAKTRDTDLDVVANFIQKNREGIHGVNRWGRGLAGACESKIDRINGSRPILKNMKNVLPEIKQRKQLRDGLEKHFADIIAARAKENLGTEIDIYSIASDSDGGGVADKIGETIEGFEGMGQLSTLSALENIRMLALPSTSYSTQRTKRRTKKGAKGDGGGKKTRDSSSRSIRVSMPR
ncbi:hypothetical protein TrST_g3042 [Triparma strigata]|uniref:Uncharacterized protein n=1 Tax=Triparma strigata TaxID=1606541 RepID=A0A9W7DV65_9STRA|nr:hypothetical protein TrST_g3042 [Triparma strigata]